MPRSSRPLQWLLAASVAACGTTGGQIAGQLGSAVADAAGHGSSRPKRVPWSTSRGRCGPFGDYQMACPVLADCHGLPRDETPTVNACDSGTGLLKPIRVCTDWHDNPYWCASGKFPPCSRLQGASCGTIETMVCDDGNGKQRVLQCCAAASPLCTPNTYYEPRRRDRSPEPADAGDAEAEWDAATPDAEAP